MNNPNTLNGNFTFNYIGFSGDMFEQGSASVFMGDDDYEVLATSETDKEETVQAIFDELEGTIENYFESEADDMDEDDFEEMVDAITNDLYTYKDSIREFVTKVGNEKGHYVVLKEKWSEATIWFIPYTAY